MIENNNKKTQDRKRKTVERYKKDGRVGFKKQRGLC